MATLKAKSGPYPHHSCSQMHKLRAHQEGPFLLLQSNRHVPDGGCAWERERTNSLHFLGIQHKRLQHRSISMRSASGKQMKVGLANNKHEAHTRKSQSASQAQYRSKYLKQQPQALEKRVHLEHSTEASTSSSNLEHYRSVCTLNTVQKQVHQAATSSSNLKHYRSVCTSNTVQKQKQVPQAAPSSTTEACILNTAQKQKHLKQHPRALQKRAQHLKHSIEAKAPQATTSSTSETCAAPQAQYRSKYLKQQPQALQKHVQYLKQRTPNKAKEQSL
eukprot:1156152-Pelagomonas_calceolata.AAC.4